MPIVKPCAVPVVIVATPAAPLVAVVAKKGTGGLVTPAPVANTCVGIVALYGIPCPVKYGPLGRTKTLPATVCAPTVVLA